MAFSPQSCDLCGLSLRHRSVTSSFSDKTFHFCCAGCKQVFHMLAEKTGSGDPSSFKDSELFKKCQELGVIPKSEAELAQNEERHPAAGVPTIRAERAMSLSLKVKGMWCPACAWVIEESLRNDRGISDVQCSFSLDRLRCRYDPVSTSPTRIIASIGSLGYEALLSEETGHSRERSKEIVRLAVSAFLTMNVMMFSFGLYAGFFTEFSRDTISSLAWPVFIMASIVLFYGGRRIYQRAWAGIFSAGFGMETLITVGAFSAYLYSTYQWAKGSIHLYFDTASMLIVLVLLGKFLEAGAKGKVREDLDNLLSSRPSKVRILGQSHPHGRYVAIEQLTAGDLFQVEEGEVIPADGKILSGKGSVDESTLTGEAVPVAKAAGGDMRSGARVIQGVFRVRAERVGEDPFIGQVLGIIEKALREATPFEDKTDRLLKWFVPFIVILAGMTGLACILSGLSPHEGIIRAVTVVVISCPCTLGIAVPLAQVAGISLAGKRGILVRDFSSFQRAEAVNTYVFDKTGTVTEGRWKLLRIIPTGRFREQELLSQAASVERESTHYIASELRKKAREAFIEPGQAEGVKSFDNGTCGVVDDLEVRIGSRGFIGKELEGFVSGKETLPLEPGPNASHVFMSTGGELSAVFVFGDEIKRSSPKVIRELKAMGHRVLLVSGDGEGTTKAVGREVGLDESYGGQLPQDKVAIVERLQREGLRVAMVGDGVNDAPALVKAHLGIAVTSGNDLGREAGGITLMRGDLGQIRGFLDLARRVNKKIRQNLGFSGLYNVIAIPIAMSGLLNPLIAVSAMLLSSLSVIANTLLLIRKAR